MDQTQQTVLIAAATGGPGYELAKLFARDGFRMVIVGKESATLHNVGEVLKTLGAKQVVKINKDLSKEHAADEIYMETRALGLRIDLLINDAGTDQRGKFSETAMPQDMTLIHQHIVSLVKLTKCYLRDMLCYGQGQIVQVAAAAPFQNGPILAVYSATKAFVKYFNEALSHELGNTAVRIKAVMPGTNDREIHILPDRVGRSVFLNDPEDHAEFATLVYAALFKEKPANFAVDLINELHVRMGQPVKSSREHGSGAHGG
jgi:short-subunit dehydrogenase